MPELIITELTKQEFDRISLPQNYVLCEQYYESEGAKTKSGIIYGVNTELTYQDSENPNDDSSHVADMAETALQVVKTPQSLYFDMEDDRSMPWETEMELLPGDFVWTNPIDALNALALKCEGKTYKLIPYQDLYVAKRNGNVVIPLNGYCLLKQISLPKLSQFDVINEDRIDKTKGIIAFVGGCNKRYRDERFMDFEDINVGDTVLFDRKGVPIALERTSYNNQFSDTGEIFWVIQRRYIALVLSQGKGNNL